MLKALFISLNFFLAGHIIAQQKTAFKFSVSSLDKSMLFDRLTYFVTPNSLTIMHGSDIDFSFGKKPVKAKSVFHVKLDSSESMQLSTLVSILDNQSLKSRYENLCIMDGLILDFNFTQGDKKKSLSLSNYYVMQMQPFIDFVNRNVPKKYKIWFDKSELENDMKDCPKWKLLDY